MTQEEKARAYDEALEKAKELLDSPRTCFDIVQLKDIFPELRESEDEIHRKWILEYLYDGLRKADEQFKDHFKSAIDWLEKQKEQKPVLSDEAIRDGVVHFGITQYQIDNWLKKHINIVEQKPAVKQDYSDLTDLERAIHRGFLCAGVENVPVGIIKETAKECITQMKPAEWSEEDERKRKELIQYLEEKGDYRTVWMTWLKSLRLQPHLQSRP